MNAPHTLAKIRRKNPSIEITTEAALQRNYKNTILLLNSTIGPIEAYVV